MKHNWDLQYPDLKKLLSQWVGQAILANVLINCVLVREMWKEFAWLFKTPSSYWLKLYNGCFGFFKQQTGIQASARHNEGSAADPETMSNNASGFKLINSKFRLKDIFKMDETSSFDVYLTFLFSLLYLIWVSFLTKVYIIPYLVEFHKIVAYQLGQPTVWSPRKIKSQVHELWMLL